MKKRVLVVDDEPDLRELVSHHLRGSGLEVVAAGMGREGIAEAGESRPDLIILDVMLPDLPGTEVLKELRKNPETAHIPVLFLTARGDEMDRVVGFELGADDYVVKPFSPRELVLRVRALLRRSEPGASPGPVLSHEGIRVNLEQHRVEVDGSPIPLTPLEFRLLTHLMERPGRVLSRDHLLTHVWGDDVFVTDRTVDTHIKRLRAKLKGGAEFVETIRGVGYRFRE